MSLVGFKARNHPQQSAKPYVDDRSLPDDAFQALHERFQFTIDVAASNKNARLPRYFTLERCGLQASWEGERVYCNPPYSNIRPWVEKALVSESTTALIVMLLPANRTEQGWWQDLVEPNRDLMHSSTLRVEFLRGRQRFVKPEEDSVKPNDRPPFGCCLLVWGF